MAKEPESESRPPWTRCPALGARAPCSLARLLDALQEAHREDVQLRTSGHLNPDKLYRPPDAVPRHWASAAGPPREPGRGPGPPAAWRVARMREALARFTVHTALRPHPGRRGSALFRYLNPRGPASDDDLAPRARGAGLGVTGERAAGRPSGRGAGGRGATLPAGGDGDRLVGADLAGVTKADRYRRLLGVQRRVLATQDLLDGDLTGAAVVAAHEQKLQRELGRLCACAPDPLARLSVFAGVFADICDGSLLFGDLLRDVKAEYELYVAILLATQPTEQHQRFLAYLRGLAWRPARTAEVQQARERLGQLVRDVQAALARNEGLRGALEAERKLLDAAKEKAGLSEAVTDEESLTLIQKVEKKRCEILRKWDEIQDLEREMKATLVHTGVSDITESAIKSVETETLKLETANRILKKNINIIEAYVKQCLKKSKISEEEQQTIWAFIDEFTRETDSHSRDPGDGTRDALQPLCV